MLDDDAVNNTRTAQTSSTEDTTERWKVLSADEFSDEDVQFIHKPLIPRGEITILCASGGSGKTIALCRIAADISNGIRIFGDENHDEKQPGNVLFVSAEDTGSLLKKRLVACGADLQRIFILDVTSSTGIDLSSDSAGFIALAKNYSPELIVFDPWHAFSGEKADLSKINQMRPILQKIVNIAKSLNCAVVLVSHVNKRPQDTNANFAASGSADLTNASRSVMQCIFDDSPGNRNQRILVHTKSNYAAPSKSIKFLIDENGGAIWSGFSDITRETLETAARYHKKPSEMIEAETADSESLDIIIDAMRELTEESERINISYDAVKEQFGNDVFLGQQPKRFLDRHLNDFWQAGFSVVTGKTVNCQGKTKNGFSICRLSEDL